MSRRLLATLKARLLEVLRDRSALAWNLLFAPMLVIGIAAVFAGRAPTVAQVGVLGDAPLTHSTHAFIGTPAVEFYREADLSDGAAKVAHQRIDLLLDPGSVPVRYWINDESAKGRLLARVLLADDPQASAQHVSGVMIRYADWLVPGLLALNITFSSLFAIGHVIVRYRRSGYLKRLNGTPLRAAEFIGAQLLACLLLLLVTSAGIFAACQVLLDLRMAGSGWTLLLVTAVGSMSLIAMSLLISARIASEEVSGGVLNLIAWPMMMLSGVFFSLDGAPPALQAASLLSPLTHLLDAARAVMLDGAGLVDVARPLVVLGAMTVTFLVIGAGTFRWRQE